jgi:peptide/nickel transport system permease protein
MATRPIDAEAKTRPGWFTRALESDLFYSFRKSPVTVIAAIVTVICFGAALLAPWIAPHNPFDVASLNLLDSDNPPAWMSEGDPHFLLGTDNQGRDVLSTILYGARISLAVGFCSVLFAMTLGVLLGLLSG